MALTVSNGGIGKSPSIDRLNRSRSKTDSTIAREMERLVSPDSLEQLYCTVPIDFDHFSDLVSCSVSRIGATDNKEASQDGFINSNYEMEHIVKGTKQEGEIPSVAKEKVKTVSHTINQSKLNSFPSTGKAIKHEQ